MSDTESEINVKIRSDASGFSDGTQEAAEKTESLTGSLRDLKSEGTQAGRTARYFANELAEIIPGAEGAAGALSSLIKIGLEGATIGGFLTAAALAAKYFNSEMEKAAELAHAARDAYRESFEAAQNALLGVQKGLQGEASKTDEAWSKTVEEARAKIAKLKQEIEDLEEHPSTGRQLLSGATGGLVAPDDVDTIKRLNAEIAGVEKGLDEARQVRQVTAADERDRVNESSAERIKAIEASTADQIVQINTAKEAKISELRNGRALDADQKAKLEEAIESQAAEQIAQIKAQREVQFEQQALGIESSLMNSRERITEEGEARIAALQLQYRNRKSDSDRAQLEQLVELERDKTARLLELDQAASQKELGNAIEAATRAKDARIEAFAKEAQEVSKIEAESDGSRLQRALAAVNQRESEELAVIHKAAAEYVITAQQAEADIAAIRKRASNEREIAYQQDARKWSESFLRPIESGLSSALLGMINGTENFSQAMEKIFEDMVKSILDTALKSLFDGFVEGFTKVLGEVAGGSVAGSLVDPTGLGAVTGAAGGVTFGEAGFLIAQRPVQFSGSLGGASAAGGGGSNVTVNIGGINTIDGRGVRDFVSSNDFVNAIAEAQRNGRLR